MSRHATAFVPLALALPFLLAGSKSKIDDASPLVEPQANMYLRHAFDKDPSLYMGRFVPDEAGAPDEAEAMQLTCSKHVAYKYVEAGGTVRDEFYRANKNASFFAGLMSILSVQGEASDVGIVRVRYTERGKLVGYVSDPEAFESCCKRAPDQCTERYVSEFLMGTGEVYVAKGVEAKGSATLGIQPVGVEVKNGYVWERATTFNDVYFAYRLSQAVGESAPEQAAGCGDWVAKPPKSSQGYYFVGMSDPLASERAAREMAMRDARVQVVRFMSESLQSGSIQVSGLRGDVGKLSAFLDEDSWVSAASQGVASWVKDENWCVQSSPAPDGLRYTVRVLGFLPNASAEPAAKAIVETVGKK